MAANADNLCDICLTDYPTPEMFSFHHGCHFHRDCMEKAFAIRKNCPKCRTKLRNLSTFHRVHANGITTPVSTLPVSELQAKIDETVKELLQVE